MNPANSRFSSSAKSLEESFSCFSVLIVVVVDVDIGAAIVFSLFCRFKGGLRTSSGLRESGLTRFLGTVVLECSDFLNALVLIGLSGSAPVFVSVE